MSDRPSPRRGLPPASRLALAVAGSVLLWRAVGTRSGADPLWFAVLFALETLSTLRLLHELVLLGRGRPGIGGRPTGADDPPVVEHVAVLVRDEPTRVVRAAVLAASADPTVGHVVLVDRVGRVAVGELARRLGVEHLVVDPAGTAETVAAWALAANATVVAVVPAAHVLVHDGLARLTTPLADPAVGVVVGPSEIVNARRRIDRPGLGSEEWWDGVVAPRLAASGLAVWWDAPAVMRTALLVDALARGAVDREDVVVSPLPADRTAVAIEAPTARALAPATVAAARKAYARRVAGRRRADDRARRVGGRPVELLAAATIRWARVRAVQRLAGAIVLAGALAGGARPLAAPAALVAGAWTVRAITSWWARRRLIGRGTGAWIVDDLRTLSVDLGTSWAPHAPRIAQATVAAAAAAALTGFVHGRPGGEGVLAIGVALWFLGAGNVARRELRRVQFRTWWRADVAIDAIEPPGVWISGVSPFGFDLETPTTLDARTPLRLVFRPLPDDAPCAVDVVVQRSGRVGDGAGAYVTSTAAAPEVEDRVLMLLASGAFDRTSQRAERTMSSSQDSLDRAHARPKTNV